MLCSSSGSSIQANPSFSSPRPSSSASLREYQWKASIIRWMSCPTASRAAAQASDLLRGAGLARSAIEGLPISIKDLFDVAGDTTAAGSVVLAGAPPATQHAAIVRRLLAAAQGGVEGAGVEVRVQRISRDVRGVDRDQRLAQSTSTAGMVWVCWPKKAAQKALGITSDLDDGKVRALGLDLGFVDVKVAAVDDTWSGLKFVRRLADR